MGQNAEYHKIYINQIIFPVFHDIVLGLFVMNEEVK